jgi:hypothetical protein
MIRTTNDIMHSLLFQASCCHLPPQAPTHKGDLIPLTPLCSFRHHSLLRYLWVFGCAYYLNTSATTPYKLAPRSYRCIFLGYSSEYKGYQCLDLTTIHMLVSQHIIFDESSFPFASSGPPPDDLDSLFSSSPTVHVITPPYSSSVAGTSEIVVVPCKAPAPPLAPHTAPTSHPCHARH